MFQKVPKRSNLGQDCCNLDLFGGQFVIPFPLFQFETCNFVTKRIWPKKHFLFLKKCEIIITPIKHYWKIHKSHLRNTSGCKKRSKNEVFTHTNSGSLTCDENSKISRFFHFHGCIKSPFFIKIQKNKTLIGIY